jgi:hypothetical protein
LFKAGNSTRQAEFQPPIQVSITLYSSSPQKEYQYKPPTPPKQLQQQPARPMPPDPHHACTHFPSTNAMTTRSQFPIPESHPSPSMMSEASQVLHLQAAARCHQHHTIIQTHSTTKKDVKNSRDEFAARCSNQEADSTHPIHPSHPSQSSSIEGRAANQLVAPAHQPPHLTTMGKTHSFPFPPPPLLTIMVGR